MSRTLCVVAGLVACHAPAPEEPHASPPLGVAISLYRDGDATYAVIDDRRSVEVTGTSLVLERIDPGVDLASLVIEPLAGSALRVGTCHRDPPAQRAAATRHAIADDAVEGEDGEAPAEAARIVGESPIRCAVHGATGPQRMRVLYVSSTLAYRATHLVSMREPARAELTTRYTIAAPAWGGQATVTLFEGVPGRETSPTPLARGTIELAGTPVTLAAPTSEVAARTVWVTDGVERADTSGTDARSAVWRALELELAHLPAGEFSVTTQLPDEPERSYSATTRVQGRHWLRVPLAVDTQLRATRTKRRVEVPEVEVAEWFEIVVNNRGDTPREVWLEQELPPARASIVVDAQPAKPTLARDRARTKLVVPAAATARATFTIGYSF